LPSPIGPGARTITTVFRPSSDVPSNVPRSMWNANDTSHAPRVGFAVNGAPADKRHGHTTSQLQFSKYSPLIRQVDCVPAAVMGASALGCSWIACG
jgi:hypothetical protein